MFVKESMVTIADDNYQNKIEYPIQYIGRSHSIESFNHAKKISFFAHVNTVIAEPMTREFFLVCIDAINTRGDRYEVICDDNTKIAVKKNGYLKYVPVNRLSATNVLVDALGYPCKILSISDHQMKENRLYAVGSNKAPNVSINGLLFKGA